MKISVNGAPAEVVGPSLAEALEELGHGAAKIATAVNEQFVPAAARATHQLEPGDRVEIVTLVGGG